ncbi:hypothetical protein PENPOL_c007G00967 [Penicillium polonicum]|uniref:Uncharacterized protein n=1 Tax=Penicillium polonicum TaxID=60169 RepID=A0A1V6NJL7_PENPO|nr:hypothetical protein PENPOL_c007G00967 [Penicillium polonicum]
MNPDNDQVANYPIPTLNNEQLELLMQLRVRRARQLDTCRAIMRQAKRIIQREEFVIAQYAQVGHGAGLHALFRLEATMNALVTDMAALRAHEQWTRTLEAEIWRQVE